MTQDPDTARSVDETAAQDGALSGSEPQGDAVTQSEALAQTKAQMKPDATPRPRRIQRRHVHLFGLWTLAIILFMALAVGITILAVTGRNLVFPQFVTDRIEEKINGDLNGPKVSIGRIVAVVDKDFVPRVTARNVGVSDATGAEVARLNTLRAVLTKEALTSGRLRPDRLKLSGAQITLRRRADGSFAFDFGGAGATALSAHEALKAIDAAFTTTPLATISQVEAADVTVTLEDARSGRVWQATDANIVFKNNVKDLDFTLNFELFNGTEDLSKLAVGFNSKKGSLASVMSLNLTDAVTRDFALQSPALSFLSVIDAPLSANMRARIGADGRLADYTGTLEIGAGALVTEARAQPLEFSGAKGYFTYDPKAERITFPQLSLSAPELEVQGRGHILLGDFDGAWPQSFTGQWRLSRLKLIRPDLFPEPLEFERGMADAQMKLAPFRVSVGAFGLKRGDLWLRGRGRAEAGPGGWTAGLDLAVEELNIAELLALWPEVALPKTRTWMAENIRAATYRDLDLALRLAPDHTRPNFALDWAFDGLDMRFMKTLPPVTGGHGYGAIFEDAMTISLDGGTITAPSDAEIKVNGTVLRIPDIRVKPAMLEVALETQSSIPAALSLMAEPPFSILRGATFGPDVAQGQAELSGRIAVPLIKKVQMPDVSFAMDGVLRNVVSHQLMPGQELRAARLDLSVDSAGVTVAGDMRLGAAAFDGAWQKKFGPDHRGKSDISGKVVLNQALLDAFKIALPEGMVTGIGRGDLTVALRKGAAPQFDLRSGLRGVGLSLPSLNWSKPAKSPGQFTLSGAAGQRPEITRLALDASGFAAKGGRLRLREGGGLDQLSFEQVTVGNWLSAPVVLVGQGKGNPVKIVVNGGTLDLAQARFGSGQGKTGPVPMEIHLDRLGLGKKLWLSDVRASLMSRAGVSGTFSGLLNGHGSVTGKLARGTHGADILITSQNAGPVVAATGVIERASDGALSLVLRAEAEKNSYSGQLSITDMRVQSAPALVELLSALSVVGVLEQMSGKGGILFSKVEADLLWRNGRLTVREGRAAGPSLGITLEGLYDSGAKTVAFQGVVSPVYFLNALGQAVSRRGEGLLGFTYTLTGAAAQPKVAVNPLSVLAPGFLREIFRTAPAGDQ